MKTRIKAMGILSLIGMIFVILVAHDFAKGDEIYRAHLSFEHYRPHTTWIATTEGWDLGRWGEIAVTGLTLTASLVLGIIHLASKKEPEKELNIAIGIAAILLGPINWILCLITFIKLSKTSQTAQVEK